MLKNSFEILSVWNVIDLGISGKRRRKGEKSCRLLTSDAAAGYYSELRIWRISPFRSRARRTVQKNCFPGSSIRTNKMKREEGFSLCKTSTFQQIENGLIKPDKTLTITISLPIQKIFSQMVRKVEFLRCDWPTACSAQKWTKNITHKSKDIALEIESFSLCKMSIIGLITNACVNGTMINQALLANTPKALAKPDAKEAFAYCWPCQTFRTHIHHLIDWEERWNNSDIEPHIPQLYALIPLMKGRPGWRFQKAGKGEKIGVLCYASTQCFSWAFIPRYTLTQFIPLFSYSCVECSLLLFRKDKKKCCELIVN